MPDLKVIRLVEGRVLKRAELDFVLNADGTFAEGPTFLTGIDRAIQDVVKALLTLLGSNFLAPEYGTSIDTLIHARKLPQVAERLNLEVQDALGYIVNFTLNEDPSERIEDLISLEATERVNTIEMDLKVQTGGGQTASITI